MRTIWIQRLALLFTLTSASCFLGRASPPPHQILKTIVTPGFSVVVPSDVEMVEKKGPASTAFVFVHGAVIVMTFMQTPEPMPTMECGNLRTFKIAGNSWTEEMCQTRDAAWLMRHAKIQESDWYLNARNADKQMDWVQSAMDSFRPLP